jgi:hypothetical protein
MSYPAPRTWCVSATGCIFPGHMAYGWRRRSSRCSVTGWRLESSQSQAGHCIQRHPVSIHHCSIFHLLDRFAARTRARPDRFVAVSRKSQAPISHRVSDPGIVRGWPERLFLVAAGRARAGPFSVQPAECRADCALRGDRDVRKAGLASVRLRRGRGLDDCVFDFDANRLNETSHCERTSRRPPGRQAAFGRGERLATRAILF